MLLLSFADYFFKKKIKKFFQGRYRSVKRFGPDQDLNCLKKVYQQMTKVAASEERVNMEFIFRPFFKKLVCRHPTGLTQNDT